MNKTQYRIYAEHFMFACAPAKAQIILRLPRILIRVFTIRFQTLWTLGYPQVAQADLSLRWTRIKSCKEWYAPAQIIQCHSEVNEYILFLFFYFTYICFVFCFFFSLYSKNLSYKYKQKSMKYATEKKKTKQAHNV